MSDKRNIGVERCMYADYKRRRSSEEESENTNLSKMAE
jgi:hypothetical protein